MKKVFLLSFILVTGPFQLANADQMVCRGLESTMHMTDVDGQGDPNFVYVQVWSAENDRAQYADIFSGAVKGRFKTVSQVTLAKEVKIKSYDGSQLVIDLKKKSLSVLATQSGIFKDSFSCKITPMNPVVFHSVGG